MAAKRRYKEPAEAPTASEEEVARWRRWRRELTIAEKREKDWRKKADEIIKRYRGEEKKRNRYNVLWANTDVLAPAIYNSKPDPDVRRRFRDADPLGKAVGEVLERSLYVMVDADSTDVAIKAAVFDALVPGRGVTRVRYVPKLAERGHEPEPSETAQEEADEEGGVGGSTPPEDAEGSYEQVEYEQVVLEHVDWRDFLHGFGRVWEEVEWEAFRHKLNRPDAEKKFGAEVLVGIEFAPQMEEEDAKKRYLGTEVETGKFTEFWEVWDKGTEQVFFVHEKIEQLVYPLDNLDGAPPLLFEGFFPTPTPLRLVQDTGSLIPIPPFTLYEEQANELDKVSFRIDKIIGALRLRGVYDAKLAEIPDLLSSEDNALTPIQNAQMYADAGGIEKAIAWMPIEQSVKVLEALYDARERQKAIIDELTGISDIVRGTTDPDETATAQQMKGGYYSVRLWRLQHEVRRYCRDLLRLASQVMAQQFAKDTFAQMTDLQFPDAAQKQLMVMQFQQAAQQAQAQGQPPPPPPATLRLPTWEQILQLMRSPALRQFRTDVETDSTIAGTLQSDMEGLATVLKAISDTLNGLAPLVMGGALPVDAAKELVMAIIRRARMGTAVEDAFDKLQAPQAPPQPQDTGIQQAQIKAQADVQVANVKAGADVKVAGLKEAAETERQQREAQQDAYNQQQKDMREQIAERDKQQRELVAEHARGINESLNAHMDRQHAAAIEDGKRQSEELDRRLDAFVKIITATIAATKQPDQPAQTVAEREVEKAGTGGGKGQDLGPLLERLTMHLSRPKRVIRDGDGKIIGLH